MTCSLCEAPVFCRGWCRKHYMRWYRHGDPTAEHRSGSSNVNWKGDQASYEAVHQRIRVRRGPAREHVCACGHPATDWAYDHADPHEVLCRRRGVRFSTNTEHYQPLCHSCHVRLDANLVG